MECVLEVNALYKSYRRTQVLNGLSMQVPKGAVYGLVGKNGAGKTTLIRVICGLQPPKSGTYTLFGIQNDQKAISSSRRRMGALVESPALYLDLSAEDNLKQQYAVLGLPSYDGLQDILTLVGLENEGKKKVKHFSLGMRQRLGIAIALVGDPDFLVLDEPVNGLDPQGIVQIRELILKLNRERQITVMISSHILEELSKVATHYGFIDNGRIVAELSAEELEAAGRKCMHLEVSDTKALARALDGLEAEYKILSDTQANVYAQIKVSVLANALAQENCELISVHEQDESLESYYINLVGGDSNA